MEELIDAFEAYQEAKEIYKERAKGVEYDRDYFLYDEQQQVNITREALAKCFEKAVLNIASPNQQLTK